MGKLGRIKEILKIALTTTSAHDIGIMYIVLGIISLITGSAYAALIRDQLTLNNVGAVDYYNAVSLHGIFMIFFMVMPISTGFANYLVPRMIGAHDLYWPKINALSFWILVPAVFMSIIAPLFGPINTGWYMYAPLSTDLQVNGGFGVTLVEVALMIAGVSSTLTGINFLMTILRLRKIPFFKMSLFTWSWFATSILLMVALPPLTAGLVMAFLERMWNLPFFNAALGGNPLLWQNVFWFFGHPEVYILILPAMGLVGEVLPRAVGRQIYGYKALALSSMAIAFLSVLGVWMHHMFTAIDSDVVREIAAATTMAIAIPSGVKVVNWTITFYGGKVRFSALTIGMIGFITLFLVGGITGVFFPLIPVDLAFNGTYLVVGHFHYMVFAILVGLLSGLLYYFPYFTGKWFDQELARTSMFMIVVGAFVVATGMSIDGVLGMPRRYAVVPAPVYQPFQNLVTVGGFVEGIGLLLAFGTLLYAWVRGPPVKNLDPWNSEQLIGIPDFTLRPIALPLSFGKEMDGTTPEHRHGSYFPSLLGLLLCFPPLGFMLILAGITIPGIFMVLAFIGVGMAWLYNDYFRQIKPMPGLGGFGLTKMLSSTPTGSTGALGGVENPTIQENGVEIARRAKTPVLFFIIAEIFLFGSFIGGYIYDVNETPTVASLPRLPVDWYPLPLIMTVVLLSSSIPAHLAYHNFLKGRIKMFKILGALTTLMGFSFLMGQVYEFTHIVKFTPQQDVYSAFFFSIVSLHAFHVIMGLVLWTITLLRTRITIPYQLSTGASYYWHFVDAVWVVVFTMLYLQLPIYHP
ncbi:MULTISPECIES: cbb3-type cytochrome c oxidase subunit I [Metallosphaera]|uniref:Cytochrome-c oxidase n=3 Tax=Metallosphaera TaxID=41980 RepID=A4YDJ9_METS5|nr:MULTISPECIES: cbb3-type cytochrome c oxidase subunit I [Metallosphaera]ABP94501.1 Cytochrome-c oxidase [Metallosphaera sedula DSM 5348]AIM26488.1 Cytochrome-c oxidase [Metallosphaera sedula]AKV73483.1 quinol oxidase subunit 1 [Metallosphaera sedula]AKV75725.1 quinol oxidase subunit 1 [Metallosphaera sedula]AKV77972.1 quinol oxidase subunit 1 [Metallosphaera sedula]